MNTWGCRWWHRKPGKIISARENVVMEVTWAAGLFNAAMSGKLDEYERDTASERKFMLSLRPQQLDWSDECAQ